MLSDEQVEFYYEHGYLHIPHVYTPDEITELSDELDRLVREWAVTNQGWTGPWRRAYMTADVEAKSKLTAMHDLQFYSAAWMRAVTHQRIAEAMRDLLGPNVELHHTTLHIKPPSTGHPFPMHQDHPFYMHADGRYVDCLVHLDDTFHENGEIRFLDGSNKLGALEHITSTADGPCTPHLPTDKYRLEDTIAVPAKRGDVVCFSIHTIHGSYINTTDKARRLVRVGYRNPLNRQYAGQSMGRPGIMVSGYRARQDGQQLFRTE
ncbi:MAG TPA: phytanoyl-CoA dioxygenase family protein [Anaerolineae bacterium]|jgi:ectoine hydroxylase-related dioxygenase (phytanoyl-CoA dioxygenase family)